MKVFRAVLAVSLLLFTAALLRADTIVDPRMLIGGDGASTPVFGSNFTFSSNVSGGGFYGDNATAYHPAVIPNVDFPGFVNVSGQDWISLRITALLPDAGPTGAYSFYATQFRSSQLTIAENTLTLFFSGIDADHPGIPSVPPNMQPEQYPAAHFSIDLYDLGENGIDENHGGWLRDGKPITFHVGVPEPGTLPLVLVGVLTVGFSLFRRWSQARQN